MASSYYELLRDPKWQRKRLEIMERDGFACRGCGTETKTLTVDHGFYQKNCKPWEYPDWSLKTLCVDCHQEITDLREDLSLLVGRLGKKQICQLILKASELIRNGR